ELELEEGQEIVGVVVQAPKTGRVPPKQILTSTLDFISMVCLFRALIATRSHHFATTEPEYRLAETEWKAFAEYFTDVLVEVDPQIPHLPPKDVIHRIYRDIRFCNDKTPYKASFLQVSCRLDVKVYPLHVTTSVKPNGESLIAAGSLCPGCDELTRTSSQRFRANLQPSLRRFHQIISSPDFEAFFSPAQPDPNSRRQNIFGAEDELRVTPKGVDKVHTDIGILKCRSFTVAYMFANKQMLSSELKEELRAGVAKVMRPFVRWYVAQP
ncbi:hypothetical protein V8D89_001016, partial [Ganoderma adspersum]